MRESKEELISTKELSRRLGIKIWNLYQWRKKGKIPLDEVRKGKKIFWVWEPQRLVQLQRRTEKHGELLEVMENNLRYVIKTIRLIRQEQRQTAIKLMLPTARLKKDAKK